MTPTAIGSSPSPAEPVPRGVQGLRVLVAGDAGVRAVLRTIEPWAADAGIDVAQGADIAGTLRRLVAESWDVVVAVLTERGEDDLATWAEALKRTPRTPWLVAVTQGPSMTLALLAERLGVPDLLPLPLRRRDFLAAIHRVRSATLEVPVPLPEVVGHAVGPYALVGRSAAMLDVYKIIARVGPSDATVLLQGESGTGKEVVARALHLGSPRSAGPFVAVNCAAIPENLLESELFGHERGAFTGAIARRVGRVEQARGGTLFLDEVADMSLALQAKMLRAIQEREIERIGGEESIHVDVRLIAATNRDLREAIAQGRLREDLYYRLAVVMVRLPTLAERGDDLLLLTAHFIQYFAARCSKSIHAISDQALDLLRDHTWIGNVRELRNVIERAVITTADGVLRTNDLPEEFRGADDLVSRGQPAGAILTLADLEARHIKKVLAHTAGQIRAAADLLGIHRNTLARKMKEYGL